MKNIKDSTIRNIQLICMYIGLSAIGFLVLILLVTVTGIYDFRIYNPAFLRDMQPIVLGIFFASGIPFIILSFFKGLPANPATYVSIECPFRSQAQAGAHFEHKLNAEGYEPALLLADESELTIAIRRKGSLTHTKIFAHVYAPVFSGPVRERMQTLIAGHLEETSQPGENIFLTLLLSVEKGSKDYSRFVRIYGQSLRMYFIHVGFNFERQTMSFISKIDGFAAGKRRQILKAFLAMLPEPERYANLNKLDGRKSKVPPER